MNAFLDNRVLADLVSKGAVVDEAILSARAYCPELTTLKLDLHFVPTTVPLHMQRPLPLELHSSFRNCRGSVLVEDQPSTFALPFRGDYIAIGGASYCYIHICEFKKKWAAMGAGGNATASDRQIQADDFSYGFFYFAGT